MTHIIGLHRKPGEDREEHDFYATHPCSILPLLELLGWIDGGKIIRENSCGQGHLSEELKKYGHSVVSSDLIDRGYGVTGVDFIQDHWLDTQYYDGVIMNPPYKHALEFVKKSLQIAPVVCAFLKIQFLEGGDRTGRHEFFKNNPPKTVAVFSDRVPSSKNATFAKGESSTVCYAWYIWERGFTGDPVIKWLRLKPR